MDYISWEKLLFLLIYSTVFKYYTIFVFDLIYRVLYVFSLSSVCFFNTCGCVLNKHFFLCVLIYSYLQFI